MFNSVKQITIQNSENYSTDQSNEKKIQEYNANGIQYTRNTININNTSSNLCSFAQIYLKKHLKKTDMHIIIIATRTRSAVLRINIFVANGSRRKYISRDSTLHLIESYFERSCVSL